MTSEMYAAKNFEHFWSHYVQLHQRPQTQWLHAVATLSAGAFIGAALITQRPVLLLLVPIADYGIAQASHRLFEKNRSTPWRKLGWHARAELRMLRLVLTGKMRQQVSLHAT